MHTNVPVPMQLFSWGCSCYGVSWDTEPHCSSSLPSWCGAAGEYWWWQPLLWDTLGQKCLCHCELGSQKIQTGAHMLCAATPDSWDTLGNLQTSPCAAVCPGWWTEGALSSEIQHFQSAAFKLWEHVVCGSQAAWCRARGFRHRGGTEQSAVQTSRRPFNSFSAPKLI